MILVAMPENSCNNFLIPQEDVAESQTQFQKYVVVHFMNKYMLNQTAVISGQKSCLGKEKKQQRGVRLCVSA